MPTKTPHLVVQQKKALTGTVFNFPCTFTIKVMATYHEELVSDIYHIVQQFAPNLSKNDVQSRSSRTGKYLGITIIIGATSQSQLDRIYQALVRHSLIKMVL